MPLPAHSSIHKASLSYIAIVKDLFMQFALSLPESLQLPVCSLQGTSFLILIFCPSTSSGQHTP
jgi:hypothetical protein